MLTIYFVVFALFSYDKMKFMGNKVLVFLGQISFALYLVHFYVFRSIIGYLEIHLHVNFWIATIGVAIPMVISLCTLITYYIEKPYGFRMKKILMRLFNIA
jgi:peptidoglycan/LPS O-acetylase OafA/YrhL